MQEQAASADRRGRSFVPSALLGVHYSWTALELLPRLLAKAGCRTTLVCPEVTTVAKSRLVDRLVGCGAGKAEFIDAFTRELAADDYDVVILGNEYYRELMESADPALLESWFPVPAGDLDAHFVFSKNAFLKRALAAGIPAPEFEICRSLGAARSTASRIGYPLVLKEPAGHAGLTTYRVDSEIELQRFFRGSEMVVQRFVSGPVGSTDVLYDRGRPLCWMSSYSGDCAPTDFSPRCSRKIIDSPALDRIVEQVGDLTEFRGFVGIDWICDERTGEFLVLEMNPNPEGGYALTPATEKAFATALRAMLTGDPAYRPRAVEPERGWIPIFPEWGTYLAERADRRRPKTWLRFARMLTRVPVEEPRIAVAQLKSALGFLLKVPVFGHFWRFIKGRRPVSAAG